ncbi:hypothetical protein [Chimaeribacter arupi]|uniref:hypothetical protein n=1 Tax=Chimaeribacter arupi TaxID=2060066 RepID=UPI0013FD061D|nr:hypothetical protein [Chimaeribacter arupi]
MTTQRENRNENYLTIPLAILLPTVANTAGHQAFPTQTGRNRALKQNYQQHDRHVVRR